MTPNSKGLLDNSVQLKKRRWLKSLTIPSVTELLNLDSPMKYSYLRTLDCWRTVEKKGNNLTSYRFCNSRWCLVCNGVRAAKLIGGYEPTLSQMDNLFLVTLTRPSVSELKLRDEVLFMKKRLRNCRENIKNKYKGVVTIRGISAIHVTYKQELDKYHPHFHLLIRGEVAAKGLVDEWLKRNPTAARKCQSVVHITKWIEMYPTAKPISAQPIIRVLNYLLMKPLDYTPEVSDVIYSSVKGLRLTQAMGIKKMKLVAKTDAGSSNEPPQENKLTACQSANVLQEGDDVFIWDKKIADWVSEKHGYELVAYLDKVNNMKVSNEGNQLSESLNEAPTLDSLAKELCISKTTLTVWLNRKMLKIPTIN